MTPLEFYEEILDPGLDWLSEFAGAPKRSTYADVMLLTIAQQESGLKHRAQVISTGAKAGPARGWWQFERGGGVAGVLTHQQTKDLASRICEACYVPRDSYAAWRCLEGHDRLAVAFARLLLWTDPAPLPGTSQEGWRCYLVNWRPGKPHPEKWHGYWMRSAEALG
jgi:hypothetical protein